jgi:WD40 repeat protein
MLASGLWDGTVILSDSHRLLGRPLQGDPDGVESLAFSRDGSKLAALGSGGSIVLWDVASHRALGEPLRGGQSFIDGVAFSPDGSMLASGGDGVVFLWDVASHRSLGEPLQGDGRSVSSVAFSPDGSTLASAGDGGVFLWDMKVTSWIDRACTIANRNFTLSEWATFVGPDVPYRATCPAFPAPGIIRQPSKRSPSSSSYIEYP